MAIITTTIREPTTFSQIQDQQNELGKSKALEDLNNNVVKLIEAINAKSEKQSANEDRQLKLNQLELSKLQLKRAQLGLANDEKYYQDYSRRWSEKNGIGTSVGIDKNTSGNIGAIGVSALTAGTLNPVVVKQVLFPLLGPPIKMMSNMMKGMFSFDRRVSGKTSSAIDFDNKNKLHGKLDSILSAIKEKTRSSPEQKKEEKSLFSKVIGSILGLAGTVGKIVLGMIGSVLIAKLGEKIGPVVEGFLTKVVGRKVTPALMEVLESLGPEMIAGYTIGGWKGALIGAGLKWVWDSWTDVEGDVELSKKGPAEKLSGLDEALNSFNEFLPNGLKFQTKNHFKAAMGGLMLGGFKGMVVGWILGLPKVKKMLQNLGDINSIGDLKDNVAKLKEGTILENIPEEVLMGAIAGGAFGLMGGPVGFAAGALLGAAGGFVWDRISNKNSAEKHGLNTSWSWSKFNYEIAGTDKTWDEFRKDVLKEYQDQINPKTNKKYTSEEIDNITGERIHNYLKENNIDNSEKPFVQSTLTSLNNTILAAGDKINEIAGDLWDSAVETCKKAIKDLSEIDYKKLADSAVSWVKGISTKLWNTAVGFCKDAIQWLKSPEATELGEAITKLCNDAVDWVVQMALYLWNKAKELGKKAIDYIGDNTKEAWNNLVYGSTENAVVEKALNAFGMNESATGTNGFLFDNLVNEGLVTDNWKQNILNIEAFKKWANVDQAHAEEYQKYINGKDYDKGMIAETMVMIIDKLKSEKSAEIEKIKNNLNEESLEYLKQIAEGMNIQNSLTEEGNKKQSNVVSNTSIITTPTNANQLNGQVAYQ